MPSGRYAKCRTKARFSDGTGRRDEAVRIAVCPPTLVLGGSQINAIDLAAAIRDRGHEVTMVATPGPLEERIRDRDLPFVRIDLPSPGRPSFHAARVLSRLVHDQAIDIVHTYETSPGLEAYFGALLRRRVPVLSTIMSWSVPRFYPRSLALTLGTPKLRADALAMRGGAVYLLEPPVDTGYDRPELGGAGFRDEWGLAPAETVVVAVSRLEFEMKLEGLHTAVDAIALLASEGAWRLVIVGGGPAQADLAARAEEVNARIGRTVVVLTGPVVDPRPAIAAADVILGQGGSALRGMAFAKPTIVLGEQGFSEVVTPETIETFFDAGYLGAGGSTPQPELLRSQLCRLADGGLRRELGQFSRRVVCDRYSLDRAAAAVEQMYRDLLSCPVQPARLLPEIARTTGWVVTIKARQRRLRTWSPGEPNLGVSRPVRAYGPSGPASRRRRRESSGRDAAKP